MTIPAQRQAEPARLVLSGELDLSNVARTQAQLDELLAAGASVVEVDLSDVTFLDLTTLRVLLRADERLRARGGRLRVTSAAPVVRRLLAITATGHLAEREPAPAAPGLAAVPTA